MASRATYARLSVQRRTDRHCSGGIRAFPACRYMGAAQRNPDQSRAHERRHDPFRHGRIGHDLVGAALLYRVGVSAPWPDVWERWRLSIVRSRPAPWASVWWSSATRWGHCWAVTSHCRCSLTSAGMESSCLAVCAPCCCWPWCISCCQSRWISSPVGKVPRPCPRSTRCWLDWTYLLSPSFPRPLPKKAPAVCWICCAALSWHARH